MDPAGTELASKQEAQILNQTKKTVDELVQQVQESGYKIMKSTVLDPLLEQEK